MTTRIVLIEDDPDIAALVEQMITDLGHRVDVRAGLGDGPADPEPRLVITDLVAVRTYDQGRAREWIGQVRRAFPNAAVLVSTAHAPAAVAGASALGADVILSKPFDVGTFTKVVESLLDH